MSQDSQPNTPEAYKAENVLPSVAAPTGTFVLQLFIIPLMIVGLIFGVWLLFSWLAHSGTSPEQIVTDLDKLNDDSWRKALTLANLLHNPQHEEMKADHALAGRLAGVLEKQVQEGAQDEGRVKLRMFVCRALGEFQVLDGLPALMLAARTENQPADIDVRRSALQAIAALAKNVNDADLAAMQANQDLLKLLEQAANERGDDETQRLPREQVRSTAAFALGVIGGPKAVEILRQRLSDPAANVRYNAATGLARHGDLAALDTLLEMIDPKNEDAAAGETDPGAQVWKRALVASNGMRALEQLAATNKELDSNRVIAALETLQRDLPQDGSYDRLRTDAAETIARLRK